VEVSGDIMTIRAFREDTKEVDSLNFKRRERHYGKIERSMKLPPEADQNDAKASYESGVLTITFPKSVPQTSGKKITVH